MDKSNFNRIVRQPGSRQVAEIVHFLLVFKFGDYGIYDGMVSQAERTRKVSFVCPNMCFLRKIWSNISICKNGKVYISNNSTTVNSIFIKNDDHFFF